MSRFDVFSEKRKPINSLWVRTGVGEEKPTNGLREGGREEGRGRGVDEVEEEEVDIKGKIRGSNCLKRRLKKHKE